MEQDLSPRQHSVEAILPNSSGIVTHYDGKAGTKSMSEGVGSLPCSYNGHSRDGGESMVSDPSFVHCPVSESLHNGSSEVAEYEDRVPEETVHKGPPSLNNFTADYVAKDSSLTSVPSNSIQEPSLEHNTDSILSAERSDEGTMGGQGQIGKGQVELPSSLGELVTQDKELEVLSSPQNLALLQENVAAEGCEPKEACSSQGMKEGESKSEALSLSSVPQLDRVVTKSEDRAGPGRTTRQPSAAGLPSHGLNLGKSPSTTDGLKMSNREEKVKVTKERISQEKQKRIEELLDAQRQAQALRLRQQDLRRQKIEEMKTKDEERQRLAQERREKREREEEERRTELQSKKSSRVMSRSSDHPRPVSSLPHAALPQGRKESYGFGSSAPRFEEFMLMSGVGGPKRSDIVQMSVRRGSRAMSDSGGDAGPPGASSWNLSFDGGETGSRGGLDLSPHRSSLSRQYSQSTTNLLRVTRSYSSTENNNNNLSSTPTHTPGRTKLSDRDLSSDLLQSVNRLAHPKSQPPSPQRTPVCTPRPASSRPSSVSHPTLAPPLKQLPDSITQVINRLSTPRAPPPPQLQQSASGPCLSAHGLAESIKRLSALKPPLTSTSAGGKQEGRQTSPTGPTDQLSRNTGVGDLKSPSPPAGQRSLGLRSSGNGGQKIKPKSSPHIRPSGSKKGNYSADVGTISAPSPKPRGEPSLSASKDRGPIKDRGTIKDRGPTKDGGPAKAPITKLSKQQLSSVERKENGNAAARSSSTGMHSSTPSGHSERESSSSPMSDQSNAAHVLSRSQPSSITSEDHQQPKKDDEHADPPSNTNTVDMAESVNGVVLVNSTSTTSANGSTVDMDQYKARLAENRRLAKEKAERDAEEERKKQDEIKQEEEAQAALDMEEQRRFEVEELKMAEELRAGEDARLAAAIQAETERREKERVEKEKMDRERVVKEEEEERIKGEQEKRKRQLSEQLQREQVEREERKRKLEMIMKRVKTNSSPSPQATTADTALNTLSTPSNHESSTPPSVFTPPSTSTPPDASTDDAGISPINPPPQNDYQEGPEEVPHSETPTVSANQASAAAPSEGTRFKNPLLQSLMANRGAFPVGLASKDQESDELRVEGNVLATETPLKNGTEEVKAEDTRLLDKPTSNGDGQNMLASESDPVNGADHSITEKVNGADNSITEKDEIVAVGLQNEPTHSQQEVQ